MNTQQDNNEEIINFFLLFKIINLYKWFILFFPIFTFIAFFYYNTYHAKYTYIAEATIKSLNELEQIDLSIFNSSVNNLQTGQLITESIKKVEGYFFVNDQEINIFNSLSSTQPDTKDLHITPRVVLEGLFKNLKPGSAVLQLSSGLQESDYNYELVVKLYAETEKIKEDLEFEINEAIKKTKKGYDSLITKSMFMFERNKSNLIKQLERENKSLVSLFTQFSDDRIIYLEEQSLIAHKLNLEEPSVPGIGASTIKANIETAAIMVPDYLRGYRAIDEEIAVLKSREDLTAFIVEYKMNEELIKLISSSDTTDILESLENTGWFDENFQIVHFNYNDVKLRKRFEGIQKIYIIISVLLSLGLGTLISIIFYLLKKNIK